MCSLKVEARGVKVTIGRVESECGGIAVVLPGAKTEEGGSEPPTPKRITRELPKPIKEEEEDDPLNYLATLFSRATFEDSDDSGDSEDDGEYDSDDEPIRPRSPRDKGGSGKFYFYTASGQIHYYDIFRNVYAANGTPVYNGALDTQASELFSSTFYLDGVPYWFDLDGLRSNNADGSSYPIITWQDEIELFDLSQFVDQGPPSNDTIFPANLHPGSYYAVDAAPTMIPATSELYATPRTKNEIHSPHSPQQGHREGAKPLMWSPTTSTSSAIVPSASRESSQPPLFEQQSGVGLALELVNLWRGDLVKTQQNSARPRPVTKVNKTDRRRCPHCNKLFRGPSSLDDHLSVHSGEKPHMCPFKGCKTGFATKSNMKRHFITHRIGQLESYEPDATLEPTASKTGKASRATSTYKSKSYRNRRSRISA